MENWKFYESLRLHFWYMKQIKDMFRTISYY